MIDDDEHIEDVVRREGREGFSKALTAGSIAANVTLGLGYMLGSPLASVAGNALTFGVFSYGTSLTSNADILEQKVIGTAIAAYMAIPVYETITEVAPLVYSKFTAGLALVKSGAPGAYVAAIHPIATAVIGAALGYLLVWGVSKAVRSWFRRKKGKKKK